jgi:SnoaL-like protein
MIAARATSDEGQTFVAGFSRSWGDPQPADFAPLFAPEIRLVAPLLPVTEGIAAAEKEFKRIFAVFEGMRGEVHDWAPHPDGVFIDFTLSATLAGRPVSWPGIDRFLLRHGQAVERLHYFDTRPLMQQAARLPRAWPGLLRAGARPRPPYLEKPGQEADLAAAPRIVRAWAEFWRAPSSEGLADLLSPRGRYLIPGLAPLSAEAEGRKRAAKLLALLPELQGRLVRWGQRDRLLYIESHVQAMVRGRLLRWPRVDRFHLTNGRVGTISAFLDTFPLASRLARSKQGRPQLSELKTG